MTASLLRDVPVDVAGVGPSCVVLDRVGPSVLAESDVEPLPSVDVIGDTVGDEEGIPPTLEGCTEVGLAVSWVV